MPTLKTDGLNFCVLLLRFEERLLPPPSFAKATDGRPSGLLSVDFFCRAKRSEATAKDALHSSQSDGGLTATCDPKCRESVKIKNRVSLCFYHT